MPLSSWKPMTGSKLTPHNRIHTVLKENGRPLPQESKQRRHRWVRYEREHSLSIFHRFLEGRTLKLARRKVILRRYQMGSYRQGPSKVSHEQQFQESSRRGHVGRWVAREALSNAGGSGINGEMCNDKGRKCYPEGAGDHTQRVEGQIRGEWQGSGC